MLSPIAEAIYSAAYVDNYLDSVENLPDDVQRCLSRIRDIDVQYRGLLRDVDHYYDLWKTLQNSNDATMVRRTRAIARMQQGLIQAQELGDEKMGIVNQLQELIDQKTRQLDADQKNLDIKEEMQHSDQLQDDCGPTLIKHSRPQSPTRSVDQGLGSVNGGGSGSSGGGGGSTPNSERSSSGVVNVMNSISSNVAISERSAIKRSRRRNEIVSSCNIDLGGNESNSANECMGSNGSSSNTLPKTNTSGAQKKNIGQSQLGSASSSAGGAGSASGSGGAGSGSGNNSSKKKKRKTRGGQAAAQANTREETPPPDAIDPDEPTYCICNQISFGEMILCDNDLCPIEWFHFSCVSLVLKPKGKWFCPNCRGDRPNVMKPKAQFLKELERFNKEKEGG